METNSQPERSDYIVHAPSPTTREAVAMIARDGFIFQCPECEAIVIPREDSSERNPRPHLCDVKTLRYFS